MSRRTMRARVQSWLLGLVVVAVGCAHPQAARVEAPPPPPRPRVKLAVLPVDADQFPQIAASLNNAFRSIKIAGVDDYFLSKVTLEVVQLSIECVQASSDCYAAAGKSLSANRLLLGRVVPMSKKKKDKSVRVTITVFDVDAGEAHNVVDHVYKSPELASQGAQDLTAEAAGEAPKMFGPEEEKPATAKPATEKPATGKPATVKPAAAPRSVAAGGKTS